MCSSLLRWEEPSAEVPKELHNISDILPCYVGKVPQYSLALMAYMVSTYSAVSGFRKDQVTANLNIHFGVVLHKLSMELASADDEEEANE